MKLKFALFYCIISVSTFGQIASSTSPPTPFGSSKRNIKFSGLSEPGVFSINTVTFRSVSQPVTFSVVNNHNSNVPEPGALALSTESKSIIREARPNYYALLIGIGDYLYSDENLRDLDKPVPDAHKLNEILTSQYGFTKTWVLDNPTSRELFRSLEELTGQLTASDNLLVFYAGHGMWDEKIRVGYWLPSDAKLSDKSTWISNTTIKDYIAGIKSRHTLIIADACFSGALLKTREGNLSTSGMANLYKLRSRKAMTSGMLTTVPDESKFIHYLTRRLTENNEPYLSSRQLFFSIETAVLNNTNNVPQFGVIQDTGDEGGDFIFLRKK